MTPKPSNPKSFTLGIGSEIVSEEIVIIPGSFGRISVEIETNVVDIDLPFLLSKNALKKAGAILNFNNDTMIILGYTIELVETENRLYTIPLNTAKRYMDCKLKPELILHI